MESTYAEIFYVLYTECALWIGITIENLHFELNEKIERTVMYCIKLFIQMLKTIDMNGGK